MIKYFPFSGLVGLTILSITGFEKGSERAVFTTTCGRLFVMEHHFECCESVEIEDVCGEVEWLVGTPVLMAEESSNSVDDMARDDPLNTGDESFTWTFYRIATINGTVVIRWYGCSNGYYSEDVGFYEEQQP